MPKFNIADMLIDLGNTLTPEQNAALTGWLNRQQNDRDRITVIVLSHRCIDRIGEVLDEVAALESGDEDA
jgi:predicted HAD superfamily phosphohydrolase YqeG